MKKLKKVLAAVLSATMVFSMSALSAFAAEPQTLSDGDYTANIIMKKDGTEENSMSAGLFAALADIKIAGDDATIQLYVANPIPMFPDQGADGTVKDFIASYNGTDYQGVLDLESKPVKLFDKEAMGTKAGESYPCDVVSITLPKSSLSATHVDLSAYVNVVMKNTVQFDVIFSNITPVGGSDATPEQTPEETTKDVTVTATVAASKADYNVTIPEAIAFGELDAAKDTVKTFDVAVSMTAGNDAGKVKVAAQDSGNLVSGEEKIAFANNFGTKEFTNSKTETGSLTVLAKDVKLAAPGEYSGTTTFTISYVSAQ